MEARGVSQEVYVCRFHTSTETVYLKLCQAS